MSSKSDKVKHLKKLLDEAIKNGQDKWFIKELEVALENAKYMDMLYPW